MSKFLNITRTVVLIAMVATFTTTFASGQILSKDELKKAIATASTSDDHERIAKHYDAKAVQLEAEAKDHEEDAAEYAKSSSMHDQKHPMSGQTASHCKLFATRFAEAAKEARLLAADHRQMAKPAKTK